jgi:hypothetical protein
MQTELGPCAQFSVYHLMQLKDGEERLKSDDSSLGIFTQEVISINTVESASPPVCPSPLSNTEKGTRWAGATNGITEIERRPLIHPKTLGDISRLLRSKNAGPYEVTLDVMFDLEAEYQLVKASNLLNKKSMANIFGIKGSDILWSGFFDQALAYKVTIPRLRNGKSTASGGYMENDVHASQQYIGLMNLVLPGSLVEEWDQLQQTKK